MPTIEVSAAAAAATDKLHVIVWEFEVASGARDSFVKAYGPAGDWAQLFARSSEFLRVELVRSVQQPNRYFTLDHWASSEAFDLFYEQNEQAYETLDNKLAGLTTWERRIGAFPGEQE